MILNLPDGTFDEYGLIEGNIEMHARREVSSDFRKLAFDAVDNLHRVSARLFLNGYVHRGYTVEPGDGPSFLHAVFGPSYIPDSHGGAFIPGHDEIVEVLGRWEFSLHLHAVFFYRLFDSSAGKLHILPGEYICDLSGRHVESPHAVCVEPDSYLS